MILRKVQSSAQRSLFITPLSTQRSYSVEAMDPESRFKFGVDHQSSAIGKIINDSPISHGKGSWLFLENGKRLLDFACGIAVTNTGHCHPKVVSAAQSQLEKLIHGQVNVGLHRPMIDLTERLLSIVPSNLSHFFFANSGAEAVENAIKVARLHTKKPNIIVFQGSFHGRTIATSALTRSKTVYKAGFGPLMDGVYVAPFPYCAQCKCAPSNNGCCNTSIREIELLLKQQTAPSETAAILIEPILGEGGYVVPPPDFLKALRKLCDKYNLLLICDEIQTGFGRTGKFFAIEHFLNLPEESPDILIMAKGIASGLPLSAIACKKELLANLPGGSIGGTYGGNVVACAAAVATIEAMKDEKMLENALSRGEQFRNLLAGFQHQFPQVVKQVRGLGLMNGIEFHSNGRATPTSHEIAKLAYQKGLLLMSAGVFDTLRFMPPLTVSEEEIDLGFSIFKECVESHLSSGKQQV